MDKLTRNSIWSVQGIYVTEVHEGSPAARSGLRTHDKILQVCTLWWPYVIISALMENSFIYWHVPFIECARFRSQSRVGEVNLRCWFYSAMGMISRWSRTRRLSIISGSIRNWIYLLQERVWRRLDENCSCPRYPLFSHFSNNYSIWTFRVTFDSILWWDFAVSISIDWIRESLDTFRSKLLQVFDFEIVFLPLCFH